MIYLFLDILFYSLTSFKTSFIIFFFNKKRSLLEYSLLLFLLFIFTRDYLYYIIIIVILCILNKYLYCYLTRNKYLILILNFLVFINIKLNINERYVGECLTLSEDDLDNEEV